MPKRMIFLLLVPFIVLIFFFGYRFLKNENTIMNSQDIDSYKYTFVHSHPFEKDTTLSFTNDGDNFEKISFNISDIFNISLNKDNEIILMPMHDNKYYRIDKNNRLIDESLPGPFTFFITEEEVTMNLYNIDIDDNELEAIDHERDKIYNVDLPSYSISGTFDDDFIYVINYTIEEKFLLHIIDRDKEEVKDVLELDSYPYDVLSFNDTIIIPTDEYFAIVNKDTLGIRRIEYNSNIFMPIKLVEEEKHEMIYFVYADQNNMTHINAYNNSFELIDSHDLDFPYMTSDIKDMEIYIIYQIEDSKEYNGKMGRFDIRTGNKIEEINIPKEKNKVQDLLVR